MRHDSPLFPLSPLLPEQTVNIPESDPVLLQGSHNCLKEPGAVFRSGCGFKLRNRLRQGCLFLLQGVVYRNVRRIQRQMAVKAAGIAQVAGGADGIRRYQKTVGIAVGGNGLEIEVVPGFLSLGSETLLGTAPEGNPADFPWSYCVFQNDMVSLLLLLFMIRLLLLLKTGGLLWHWQKVSA